MKTWNVNVRYGYDNNIDDIDNITLNLPNQFKKKDIEALITSNYSDYKTVNIKVTYQKPRNFNYHELTQDENTAICLANMSEW